MKLKFSPYAYARVSVMRAKLLKQADYVRLQKMGYHEILRSISESGYRKEMDQFDVSSESFTALEAAFNSNLLSKVKKLHYISEANTKKLIEIYSLRYDLEMIKTILRGISTKTPKEEIELYLQPSINFSQKYYQELLRSESIAQAAKLLPCEAAEDLFSQENNLDVWYYKQLAELALEKPLAKIIDLEIEAKNILLIIKNTFSDEDLIPYLVKPSSFVQSLRNKKQEEIYKILKEKKLIEDSAETGLLRYTLKKQLSLIHQATLSPVRLVSYLFAKEIEVRNLKMLLKGKKLNVEANLVI